MVIIILFIVSLFRGNGKDPSVINVTKCKPADHVLLIFLILSGILLTIGTSVWVRREYIYKQSIGYTFVQGDIKIDIRSILKLGAIGFSAGFM